MYETEPSLGGALRLRPLVAACIATIYTHSIRSRPLTSSVWYRKSDALGQHSAYLKVDHSHERASVCLTCVMPVSSVQNSDS